MIVPYAIPLRAIRKNHFFRLPLSRTDLLKGRENKRHRIKKRAIWTHLSACISASQENLGSVEPGKQSNTRLKISQPTAGKNRAIFKGK
jgi:hypothetical protein